MLKTQTKGSFSISDKTEALNKDKIIQEKIYPNFSICSKRLSLFC